MQTPAHAGEALHQEQATISELEEEQGQSGAVGKPLALGFALDFTMTLTQVSC